MRRSLGGFTLVEMSISMGVIALFIGIVLTTTVIANRSYRLIGDNDSLARQDRAANMQIAAAIRSADFVLDYGTDPAYLTLLCGAGEFATNVISFVYDGDARELLKISDETNIVTLLNDCEEVKFQLFQREYMAVLTNILYEPVELFPDMLNSCQSVQVFWKCRRYLDAERTRPSSESQEEFIVRLRN